MSKRMITAAPLAAIATVAILAAGCASTDQPQTAERATHYWESTASTRQYNADNAACEQATRLDANGELDPSSASFDAYRDCMIEHGYTLRTY